MPRLLSSQLLLLLALCALVNTVYGKVLKEVPNSLKNLCSDINAPTMAGKQKAKLLTWLLQATSESSLKMRTSPQHQAACWMLYGDPMRKKVAGSRAVFRQRYAMATFYYATQGPAHWYPDVGNPNATTSAVKDEKANHWLSNYNECTWYGVQCTSRVPFGFGTVSAIDVTFFGVAGILPREMALLTNLRELDLHGNDLQGVLPHLAIVNWKKMEYLRLHMNGFFGNLLKEMENMKNLREMTLFGNYFAGTIPKEIANLRKLGEFNFVQIRV